MTIAIDLERRRARTIVGLQELSQNALGTRLDCVLWRQGAIAPAIVLLWIDAYFNGVLARKVVVLAGELLVHGDSKIKDARLGYGGGVL